MDKGHVELIGDLAEVFRKAWACEFHDFKTPLATPKMELWRLLDRFARKAKNGHYDNSPDEADTAALKKLMDESGMSQEMQSVIFGKEN